MASNAIVGILRALLTADTAQFESGMRKAADSAKQFERDWKRVGQQATQVGAALTKTITLPLAAIGGAAVKSVMDFESSFAGIRKTVKATETQFGDLAKGMRGLSKEIPINVNELNKIGEAAGQLGIKTENILKFTKVMAQLGVTTNLSSEEAAMSLAQLANITQMPQGEFDRLGSTVVALGNTMATTESKIVDFGLRIAGAGAQAGLSEADILGIGAAMASVGIEAEAGGTAVQKVLLDMVQATVQGGKQLETFGRTAGMSGAAFKAAFEADAAGAFQAFVEGLGRQGKSAITTLDELGLADQRLIRSFLALSGAGDKLGQGLSIANTGWKENTALSKEAEERFKTLASQLTILWNNIGDVAISLGEALLPTVRLAIGEFARLVPVLEGAVAFFVGLPEPLKTAAIGLTAVAAVAGPMIWTFGQLAISVSVLAGAFTTKGIAAKGLAVSYGLLATAARTAWAAMLGPIGAVLGAALAMKLVADHLREASGMTADELSRLAGESAVTGAALDDMAFGLRNTSTAMAGLTKATPQAVAGFTGLELAATAAGVAVKTFAQRVREKVAELRAAQDPVENAAKAILEAEVAQKAWTASVAESSAGMALNLARWAALPAAITDAKTAIDAIRGSIVGTTQNIGLMNQAFAGVPTQFMGKGNIGPDDRAGESWKTSFGQTLQAQIGPTLLASFTGGGNPGKSLGGLIGGELAGGLVKKVAASGIGKALGGVLGSVVPGLGTILGGLAGGVIGNFVGNLFGGGEKKKVQEALGKLFEGAGGKEAFTELAKSAGVTDGMLSKLFNATKLKDYEAALRAITGQMELHNQELLEQQQLTDAQAQRQQMLEEAVGRYKFAIEELGPALRNQQLAEQAEQILDDWKLLTGAGVDVNAVIREMGPSINEFLNAARRTGTEVPEAMRPILQSMIDQGRLTDENGVAFENLEATGVTFGQTLTEMFRGVLGRLDEFISKLMGLPSNRTIDITINEHTRRSSEDVGGGGGGGDDGNRGGIAGERMHSGGIVSPRWSSVPRMFSDEVPIIAQTGEGVLSRQGMAAFNAMNAGHGGSGEMAGAIAKVAAATATLSKQLAQRDVTLPTMIATAVRDELQLGRRR